MVDVSPELPDASLTVAILCSFASGISMLRGLKNLKVKESDRIAAIAKELRKFDIIIKEFSDGWEIHGNPALLTKGPKNPISIETYNDHRIAMCFGMLKPFFPNLHIENPGCVSKSYPDFWKDFNKIAEIFHAQRSFRADSPTQKNIILAGMRGCGKSTLGKLLAKKLHREFYDTDELIERDTRITIPEIVEKKGWKFFRALEKEIIRKISEKQNAIIAVGGGSIMDNENVSMLKKNGFIVLIKTPVPILIKRLEFDTVRPSLTGKDPRAELLEVWESRKKQYESVSDLIVSIPSSDEKRNLQILWDSLSSKI